MTRLRLACSAPIAVAGLLVLGACTARGHDRVPAHGASVEPAPARASEPSAPSVPLPPDFELDRLGGGSVRLRDHLGKDVVLIDFWATYCAPCLVAMPHLDALYRDHKVRGFVVLGVAIDGPESILQVTAEVARLGVSFPILLDQETRVVALYNPKASAPYSVLIGRDGRVLAKIEGYTAVSAGELDRAIAKALAE